MREMRRCKESHVAWPTTCRMRRCRDKKKGDADNSCFVILDLSAFCSFAMQAELPAGFSRGAPSEKEMAQHQARE